MANAIDAFLDEPVEAAAPPVLDSAPTPEPDDIDLFLDSSDTPTPAFSDESVPQPVDAVEPVTPQKDNLGTLTQVSQGMMGEFADLLGLPGEAANWVSKKMGSDQRFHTGETLRRLGSKAGVTLEKEQEPDTAAIKIGQYAGMGLEFLAPFLGLGKAATMAKAAPGAVAPVAVPTTKVGLAKDIAAKTASPFVSSPKAAMAGEIAGTVGAGAGAYYGGKEYGDTGELLGGLVGGMGPQVVPMLAKTTARQIKKSLMPMTPIGSKIRAREELHRLAERDPKEIVGTIANEAKKTLPGAGISPARLSGDKHLIAMEESILKQDPQLAHIFELKRAATNQLAREEIKQLGGKVPIEKTQAYLNWRVDHVNDLIDSQVDTVLTKAKQSLDKLTPSSSRATANTIVNEKINTALSKARAVETEAWNKVDKSVQASTSSARETYKMELEARAASADPSDIEKFIPEFLGRYTDDGSWELGKFDLSETVHELATFRSRLTKAMRKEAASDSPDWNKHRIMDDIQEAVLDDLARVDNQAGLSSAVEVSRKLNQTFKSDALNTILGHKKAGGQIAPELTLEGMRSGPKAAVMAREIVNASPDAKPAIEDFIKAKMASSLVDQSTGRLKVKPAKKYVDDNEMLLDMFPQLRLSIEHAIGQEERAIATLLKGKAAKKKLHASTIAKIGGAKPGRVLNEILTSSNPGNAMAKVMGASNKAGKEGIKSDVMDYLLNKSKTGQFNDDGVPVHSGRKMAFEWMSNKDVFSKALTTGEMKRVDTIVNTLVKNEKISTPDLGEVMAPNKGVLLFLIKFMAAQRGAEIGKAVGPGTIQVPGYFAKRAELMFSSLDTGKAKQLLVDSIQDEKLFKELMADVSTQKQADRVFKVLQGWMLAHSVKTLEDE